MPAARLHAASEQVLRGAGAWRGLARHPMAVSAGRAAAGCRPAGSPALGCRPQAGCCLIPEWRAAGCRCPALPCPSCHECLAWQPACGCQLSGGRGRGGCPSEACCRRCAGCQAARPLRRSLPERARGWKGTTISARFTTNWRASWRASGEWRQGRRAARRRCCGPSNAALPADPAGRACAGSKVPPLVRCAGAGAGMAGGLPPPGRLPGPAGRQGH